MSLSVRAYVGLGSNLDDPKAQVTQALRALATLPSTACSAYSSLYRSAPMGPADQPDYINAVAALDTSIDADQLLAYLQVIEQAQGRERDRQRWGPRRLDLDLLLYGNLRQNDARLTLPHAGVHERLFVLLPLQEIAPDLVIADYGDLSSLITRCQALRIERLPGSAFSRL